MAIHVAHTCMAIFIQTRCWYLYFYHLLYIYYYYISIDKRHPQRDMGSNPTPIDSNCLYNRLVYVIDLHYLFMRMKCKVTSILANWPAFCNLPCLLFSRYDGRNGCLPESCWQTEYLTAIYCKYNNKYNIENVGCLLNNMFGKQPFFG